MVYGAQLYIMFLLEWFSPISIMFHNKSFGLIINEPKILLLDDLFWTLMVHLLMTNLSYLRETETTIAREEKRKLKMSGSTHYITVHTQQFQGLCSTKMSREMLQNLLYCWNKKTQIFFIIFDFDLIWIFVNEIIPKIWEILKRFSRYFH